MAMWPMVYAWPKTWGGAS